MTARTDKDKSKNFPKRKKQKLLNLMKIAIQFEHRASSSRSKHEGESSRPMRQAQPDSRN